VAFLVFTHIDAGHGVFVVNKYSAKAFASSVLPTPVVPKKRKSSYWFSCLVALERRTASLTASIASSCPTTAVQFFLGFFARLVAFSSEFLSILATTSAMSSRVTSLIKELPD
jgi:hypothetical protein